jgi:N-acetylglucosamine kinase-like BadF-type ATPase
MRMPFLGVDGGGTKTAFALISKEGDLLASAVMGPSHPDQIVMDGVHQTLQAGVAAVCSQAGISTSAISFSFWGLPGFGENLDHIPGFERAVADILQHNNFRLGNDVEAGWAGSLACRPGVHLVAGTGAIGFGADHKGNTARCSGWSELFGDEGSAYWLGRHLLGLFSKQSDGRLPKSPLYHIVKQKLGLERDLDLLARMDLLSKRDEVAGLAVLVYEAAEQGDENAAALYREAAFEHSLTVKSIIQQLEFPPDELISVSYSGGVFKSGDYVLAPLREYLNPLNAALVQPKLSPVTGACLYAMVLAGNSVDDQLVERLQAAEKGLA